ncbi:MAG TPA: DUF5362 family protein [Blastocatellia bacterium]|nr:DUF5362 family protein [Blastocatellia bacterium]
MRGPEAGSEEQPGGGFQSQPGFTPEISSALYGNAPRYDSGFGDIMVTPVMVEHLRATRPWVKFLGILHFVLVGLMALAGLIAIVVLSSTRGAGASPALGFLYWLIGLFYIAPAVYLNRYAGAIRELLQGGGAPSMERALESQKSFWRYAGILTLVAICIYALVLLVALLAAAGRSM